MDIKIKIQGWHCQQMLDLANAEGISPTKLINNLLTMAALSAQENKNGEAINSVRADK